MVNYELYKIFYVVAINQNITKASQELNISQPAVTKHIKNLENTLGVNLFIRTRKGVVLTEVGEKIFIEVKKSLTILNNLENEVKKYTYDNVGTIRIGVSTSFVKLYLMDKINKFHQSYPNVKFEINTDITSDNIKLLQKGLLDIIICKLPETLEHDLIFTKIGETSYEFVCNKELYNKIKQPIKLNKLIEYPIILQKSPASSYMSAKKFFDENNLTVESKLNIGSASLLIDFIKMGYGVGYITKLYVDKELNNNLFIVKTIPETPKIDYGYITLNNNILSNILKKFIDEL